MSALKHTPSGVDGMKTIADALRWALMRIETANLGEGDYFARAQDLLSEEERIERPMQAHPMTWAAADVLIERGRQQAVKGWTPEHDDEHGDGSMAKAAACYALHTEPAGNAGDYLRFWPWDAEWWKPKDRRRNLVKAAALLLAEIERLDRADAIAKATGHAS